MTCNERKRFFRETSNNKYLALSSRPLRVKVYARVSTEHESQINALKNQLEWYLSQLYDNWIFDPKKDMYVDEGITGTSANKRDAFLQMIEDAKSKDCDFDIIITREVCRFARNVEETFRYTRELKEQGIGVYFISDNIWSFDDSADGIVKLSIMASLAQGESKKVSERSLAGQAVSREHGQPYGNGNILGYDKVHHAKGKDINPKTGKVYETTFTYVINEVQAATIRRIFELCRQGLGSKRIKNILIEEGHRTATGKLGWQESVINRILNNPTYMGYNAYGKSKVVDFLSHEVEYEHDLSKLQLVKGDWEPIISEEDWYEAYNERQKRKVNIENADGTLSKYGAICAENMWVRKLQCQCGTGFRREEWRKNKLLEEVVIGYQCYNRVNRGKLGKCNVNYIQECKLDIIARKIFERMFSSEKDTIELAIKMIIDCQCETITDNSRQIKELNKLIQDEEDAKVNTALMLAKNLIDENLFKKMSIEINEKIKSYKVALMSLEENQTEKVNKQNTMENIEKFFSTCVDFTQSKVDYNFIDIYTKKVICREDSEFVWVLSYDMHNTEPIKRINHLSEEYKKTLVVDTNFNIFLEFEISVDECAEYMKSRGRIIRKAQWKPLKVKVALQNK